MNYPTAAAVLLLVCCLAPVCVSQTEPVWKWTDAATLTVEGRGWKAADLASPFDRLPAKAKGIVRQPVWDLGTNSAGIAVRFVTSAPAIRVKWSLNSASLDMPHMPSTGMSGLDLYVREQGRWTWVANGRPSAADNESTLIDNLAERQREWTLYLPLYNGVKALSLAVPEGFELAPAPARTSRAKPVVVYGTSITQGGCASRPGMAYTSIIGRRLDTEMINLGFSGNGKGEPEMARLISEIDASVFVIDTLPNMGAVPVDERIRDILAVIKREHPRTPVVLVESAGNQNHYIRTDRDKPIHPGNPVIKKIYDEQKSQWDGRLFYIEGRKLVGTDHEGTVDGVHATDLGFMRMADVMTPVIRKAIAVSTSR